MWLHCTYLHLVALRQVECYKRESLLHREKVPHSFIMPRQASYAGSPGKPAPHQALLCIVPGKLNKQVGADVSCAWRCIASAEYESLS